MSVKVGVLLCCGEDGLLEHCESWQPIFCPLPAPSLMAVSGTKRAFLDNTEHLLWLGDQLFPVDGGVECLLLWHDHPLFLSGETDSLTLLEPSSGTPLFLAPAGIYPQDMCLLPDDTVAVCGGGAGVILLMHLPELQLIRRIQVPGSAQRIIPGGKWLYVLCTIEDDGLQSLLCRVDPRTCRYEPLYTLFGLPGALHINERGLWVSASESLYRFCPGEHRPMQVFPGFGLIRHIASRNSQLLLSDPIAGSLFLLKAGCMPRHLLDGDVGQAAFL